MNTRPHTLNRRMAFAVAVAGVLTLLLLVHSAEVTSEQFNRLSPTTLALANVTIDIAFAPGALVLSQDQVAQWVTTSAQAVVAYYGQFPVPHVR